MPWGASERLVTPRVIGSIWAGTLLTLPTLMWLLGVNNVREPAEGRAVPVLDLPATVGLISLILAQKGGLYYARTL